MTDTSQTAAQEGRTDVAEFITDIDAGIFEQRAGLALSHVAGATMYHGGTGEVVIKFQFTRINGTKQIQCKSNLRFTSPTSSGKASEESACATVLHVGKGGRLSLMPEAQMSFLERSGELKQK